MPQTFYIESDEEIISVISRLRRSPAQENFFVFPKRALVLQSIVNLRLFQREAEKIGKKIIIVTQDEAGETLVKRAGLQSERYTDDFSRQQSHVELVSPAPETKQISSMTHIDQTPLQSKDIGSDDFYSAPQAITKKPKQLRIRNASPEKQTSLNSKRFEEESRPKKTDTSSMPFHPMVNIPVPEPEVSVPLPSGKTFLAQTIPPKETKQEMQSGREERIKSFFAHGGVAPTTPKMSTSRTASPVSPSVPIASKKVHGIFLLLGGVSLFSLAGVIFFLFLTKAEVQVTPYKTMQSADLQFEGKPDVSNSEGNILPVRVTEKEQSVTLSLDATGTSAGTAQKARGTVVISNRFNADAQTLVATTRIESPEGKIFRLIEGVTVPGMVNNQPGTIEAAVIADQTGSEYNITGTTFTIPGFKGSPKYEKFSAQSNKPMTGGGSGTGSDVTVISKSDLDRAEITAKEQAKEQYIQAVEKELLPGERILKEGLDITETVGSSLPLAGTAATSFEYTNTYKVRGFIFSEDMIKQKIISQGEETVSGILFRPTSVTLTYGEAIPDYNTQTVRLKTHASITSESVIDREKLLTEVLGKDADGINALLPSFPEIKKIKIVFNPRWFSSSVPTAKSRVTVLVEPGEE